MGFQVRRVTTVEPVHVEEFGVDIRPLFMSTERSGSPEAFMVEQPAGMRASAHFHDVPQFQVFMGTPGARFQRRPIPDILLVYTDPYMTYGPFEAGSSALNYYTLRPRPSGLHETMPGGHKPSAGVKGRKYLRALSSMKEDTSACEEVIEPHADGLSAWMVEVGSGRPLALPECNGVGRYVVAVSGSVSVSGEDVSAPGLAWNSGRLEYGGDAGSLEGVDGSARALVLDLPHLEAASP